MRVLDFNNKKLKNFKEPIEFGRDTVMVMCRIPKVIVFENSTEIWKFKAVWEDVIQPYIEKHLEDEDYELDYIAGWYVDQFEEESFMRDDEEDEDRNLTLFNLQGKEGWEYEDEITIKFGVLNSKDTYTDMDTLQKQVELIDLLLSEELMFKRLKDDTKEMFKIINEIWKEDILAYKNNQPYFEVGLYEECDLEYKKLTNN